MATYTIPKPTEDVETATFTGKGLTMNCYRKGNVVMARLASGQASSSISAGATILTIGEGYRPYTNVVFLSTLVTTSGNNVIRMQIDTSGVVSTIGTAISSGQYPRFTETYIAKD